MKEVILVKDIITETVAVEDHKDYVEFLERENLSLVWGDRTFLDIDSSPKRHILPILTLSKREFYDRNESVEGPYTVDAHNGTKIREVYTHLAMTDEVEKVLGLPLKDILDKSYKVEAENNNLKKKLKDSEKIRNDLKLSFDVASIKLNNINDMKNSFRGRVKFLFKGDY